MLIDDNEMGVEELQSRAERIGYPLAIKPNTGTMGRGVLTGINSWDELRAGYLYLVDALSVRNMVMEQHFEGEDFRILVIGDKVVAACKRIPANVQGDGLATIAELIRAKNIAWGENPFLIKGVIRAGQEVEQCRAAEARAWRAGPAAGGLG